MNNQARIFDLSGKTAVVAGAAGGLGKAITKGLYAFGANLMLFDRDEDGLADLKMNLHEQTDQQSILDFYGDITEHEHVEKCVNETVNNLGRIDVLVNAAGINIRKDAINYTVEEWTKVITINLTGIFIFSQAVGRIMLQQKSGSIINIASTLAAISQKQLAPYAASKGGVFQLTKVLAEEWAMENVRVNAIGPGYFETPLTKDYLARPQIRESLLGKIPAGRFGDPEELVGPVVFLASDASKYVNGHMLYVDGGRLVV